MGLFISISFISEDAIAQAQSGTGKTATFAISLLQNLDHSKREVQALVLAPTRELAVQFQKVALTWTIIAARQSNHCLLSHSLSHSLTHVLILTICTVFFVNVILYDLKITLEDMARSDQSRAEQSRADIIDW